MISMQTSNAKLGLDRLVSVLFNVHELVIKNYRTHESAFKYSMVMDLHTSAHDNWITVPVPHERIEFIKRVGIVFDYVDLSWARRSGFYTKIPQGHPYYHLNDGIEH